MSTIPTIQVIAQHEGARINMTAEVPQDAQGVYRITDTARETADTTVMALIRHMVKQGHAYQGKPTECIEQHPVSALVQVPESLKLALSRREGTRYDVAGIPVQIGQVTDFVDSRQGVISIRVQPESVTERERPMGWLDSYKPRIGDHVAYVLANGDHIVLGKV